MSVSARTTASVENRQASVVKSKYPIYSPSGGTITEVTAASTAATASTGFLPMKCRMREKGDICVGLSGGTARRGICEVMSLFLDCMILICFFRTVGYYNTTRDVFQV